VEISISTGGYFGTASGKCISTGGFLKKTASDNALSTGGLLYKTASENALFTGGFLKEPPVKMFPRLFSKFQTILNYRYIYLHTHKHIYIYIYIDIESNMELNSIIHLYTSKYSVYNHICFMHSIHQKFSPKF
jgi:hypothetical protein